MKVKRQLNRKLKIDGIVMTMVDFRTVYIELNFCCRAEKEQSFGTIPVGL